MKVVFLFPGYGSQFVGMGKGLYDDFRIVQEYFEEASNCLGHNFVKLCFAASEVELSRMELAYPSLFLVSSAIAHVLKEEGINPNAVAGYNVGEYAAIYAAHGFSFPDGLYLLSKYATFYHEIFGANRLRGIRISGLTNVEVNNVCQEVSDSNAAVYNVAQEQEMVHVIMGYGSIIDHLYAQEKAKPGVHVELVPMEFGGYSELMHSVSDQYKIYMEKVDFKDLEVPLYSAIDAKPVTLGWQVKERVIDQLTHKLRWYDILKKLHEYDCIVQIGPGNAMQKVVHALYPEKICVAINTKADIKSLKQIINSSIEESEEQRNGSI